MQTVLLQSVLLFVLLMVPGLLLGRSGLMQKNALPTLTNILLYAAMPSLVFQALCRLDPSTVDVGALLLVAAVPVVFETLWILLTALFAKEKAVVRFCSVFSNCGFLGVPLASVMFPDAPEVTVMVSVFNVFSSMMLWTAGVFLLSKDRRAIAPRRALLNPLSFALVLGAICMYSGFGTQVSFLVDYAGYLAGLTTPLAMLVLGFEFSALSLKKQSILWKDLLLTCAIKLVAFPLSVSTLLYLLKLAGVAVSYELFAALFLASAVSTAATAPALAEKYGADAESASILTLATTLGCVVTLPCLFSLLHPLF